MDILNWLKGWLGQSHDERRVAAPLNYSAKLRSLQLEDRRVLSVTPVLTGGVLGIGLSSAGDSAKVSVTNGTINVTDQANVTTSFTQSAVNKVQITGAGLSNQSVIINGANPLSVGSVSIEKVTDVSIQAQVNATTGSVSIEASQSISLSSLGTDILAFGSIDLNGAVQLTNNVTLASTNAGNISFQQTVDGTFGLTVNTAGATEFHGVVGTVGSPLTSLKTDVGGTTVLYGNITSTGNIQFNDNVLLANDISITSIGVGAPGSNLIDFEAKLDGAHSLMLDTAGVTRFNDTVGGSSPLSYLATDAPGTTSIGADIYTHDSSLTSNDANNSTQGLMLFNDQVILTKGVTLSSTGVDTTANRIDFESTVNSALGGGSMALTLNTAGGTKLNGVVGGITALQSLTTDSAGFTTLNANVRAAGLIQFNDAVTLTHDVVLTSTGGGNIGFASTLDGLNSLQLDTQGVSFFNGVVGGMSALKSLTTNAGGSTSLGANITTTGAIQFNDAVNLLSHVDLASTGSGNIDFFTTVNGANSLNVWTQGTTAFHGLVGGTTALKSLMTDAGGATQLFTHVTTTGDQVYHDSVQLLSSLSLTTTANGNLVMDSALAMGGHDLTLSAAGAGDVTVTGPVTNGGNFTVASGNHETFGAMVVALFTVQQATSSVLVTGAIQASGAVSITSSGSISESGSGQITGTSLATHSATGTTLNGANQFSSFSAVNTTSGNISFVNGAALQITGIDETGGNVSVTNAGTITVAGQVQAATSGSVSLVATGVTSDVLVNADVKSTSGALTLNAGKDVVLNAGSLTTSGAINLTAGKTISEAGTGTISGGLLTTSSTTGTNLGNTNQVTGFNAANSTSGDITLINSGALQVTGISETGGNVSITQTGTLSTTGSVTTAAGGNISFVSTGTQSIGAPVAAGGGGTVTLTSSGGNLLISGQVSSSSGTIEATANSAITQSGAGAFSTSGLLTTHSTTGQVMQGANSVGSFHAVNTVSGNLLFTNSGSLSVTGIDETGGDVSVLNAGTLTISGTVKAASAGSVSLVSTGSASDVIVLADVLSGTGVLLVDAGRDVQIDSGNLTTAGSVDLTAGKKITEIGTGVISGAGLVTRSSTGTLLTNLNHVTGFQALNTVSGDVKFSNTGALTVAGIDETGGLIELTNVGTVTVTGQVKAATSGTVQIVAIGSTSDIELKSDVRSGSGAVSLNAGQNVVLNQGGISTGGGVNLTADKSISEVGVGLITGGLLSTSSTTGTVLNNANQVTGFHALNTVSGNVSLVNSGDVNITGINETGGNVSVTDSGTITVSGLVHASGTGTVTLTANGVTSDINANADVTSGTGELSLLAGKNITLNQGNLTTTGPVNLTAGKSISEAGVGLITGGLLTTTSTTGTTLNNTNLVSSFHALNTASGNVSLTNSGPLNITGIDETGGNISVTNAGTVTVSGVVQASGSGTVNLTASGALSDVLVNANIMSGTGAVTVLAGQDVTLNAGSVTTSGSVNLTAGKAITEAGAGLIIGGLLTTNSTTGTSLNNTNQVTGFHALNTVSGNVSLVNSGDLNITEIDETGGNVSVTDSGTITVSGLVQAAGAGTVNLTANGVTSDIELNADVTSGTGALTLLADRNITLNAGNLTTTGPVNLTAGKSISEAGVGLITGGLLTTTSTTGTTLNNTNLVSSFHALNTVSGNVSLVNSGALSITGIDETGGNVSVINAGTITVAGLVTASGNGTVGLTASGATSDVLVNANITSGTGAVTLLAGEDITLNAGNLTTAGSVNLTAGKSITEAGVGLIRGGLLTTSSTTGTTLNNSNQVTGFHALNTVSGNVSLVNSGDLNITGIDETGGNVSVTDSGTITVSGLVQAAGAGTINLTANGVTSDIELNADVASGSGALSLLAGKNLTLKSGNLTTTGPVNLTAGKSISEAGIGLISGGLLTTTSTTGTTLNNTNLVSSFHALNTVSGNISLTNSGPLSITGIDEIGGNVSVINAGTITVAGLVTASGNGTVGLTASGATSDVLVNANITSGTGAVTLLAGEDITLNAGNLTTAGSVNLTAGKSITEAGVGLIRGGLLTTSSTTGTTLNNSNQVTGFHALNNGSGNVSLVNSGDLNITGIDETGGNVTVTDVGTITVSGLVQAAGAGTVTLTANGLTSDINVNADVKSGSGALDLVSGQKIVLNDGNLATGGSVNLSAGKSIAEAGSGLISAALLTTSSSTGTVLSNTNQISGFHALNTVSGNITLVNSGALNISGIDETGGSISVENAGTMTVSGIVKSADSGTVNLTTTGATADILVNADVNSDSGLLSLTAGQNIVLDAGSLSTGGDVHLTAAKAIAEVGFGTISGTVLATSSSTGTLLDKSNNVSVFHALNTVSGDISLVNGNPLNITGVDETGGNVSVINVGSIMVTGLVQAAAGGTVNLTANGVTSDIDVNADVMSGTGTLNLVAGQHITLDAGNLTTSGAVNLTAGKSISEVGVGLITGGLLSTSSTTGAVLNNTNQVTGFHALNTVSGNVSLVNSVDLNITGINETGGNVSVTNGGTITVSGLVHASGAGTVSLTANGVTSDIELNADVTSGTGALSLLAGKNITLNVGNLTTTGPVNLTAGMSISEVGVGLITGGLLTTNSTTGTTLNNTNLVSSFHALNTVSGNVSLTNSGALNITGIDETGGHISVTNAGTVTVSGLVTAAGSGTVNLTASGALSDVLVNANITSGTGAVTLIAGEDITLNAGNLTTAGSVNLTAGKSITEAGAGLITGGLLTTNSTTGTLLNNTNQVTGFHALNTVSGNVSLVNSGDLNITGIDETGGNVSVTDAGTITVSGLVEAAGAGTVNLTASGVTSDINVNADVTSGTGALSLLAGKSVTLNAGNLTTAGPVNLTAGKSISEAGVGVITGGLLTTSSTTGTTLDNTNRVSSFHALNTVNGNVSLVNSGDLNITGVDETGGNVSVTNAGTITVSGLVQASGAGTVNLTANGAASNIDLNADVKSGTGEVALLAGENITLNAGNLSTAGPVNLTAGKSISETGVGLITGGLLSTSSTTGTVLNNTNQVTGFHALNTVSGNVSLVNNGALNITGIHETGGNVSVTDSGTITVSGLVHASGAGTVSLTANGVTSDIELNADVTSGTGALTLLAGENITLNAGNLTTTGPVNLTAGKSISEAGVGLITGGLLMTSSTTGTTLNNTNLVSSFRALNTASGNVSLTNSGPLNITGIDETGGNISVTNAGTITVSGLVQASGNGIVDLIASGALSDVLVNENITSGTGAVTLLAGQDVTLNAGSVTTSGSVNLTAGKAITEAGAGLITGGLLSTNSTTGTSLNNTNQVTGFHALNTVSGNVSLVNIGDLNITGIDETGGNVSVTDSGTITVSGLVHASGAGTVSLTANGFTSDIELNADVTSGTGALTLLSGKNITLNAGNLTTTGPVNLTAGKSISEAGVGLITGGLLTTSSTTGTTLNNTNLVSSFHALNTASGNVSLTNSGALTITGIDETGGNVSVTNAGTITVSGVVQASGAGTVDLTASGALSDVLVNADITSATEAVTLVGGEDITLNAGNLTTTGSVNLTAGKSITEVGTGLITGNLLTTSSTTGTLLNNTNHVSGFHALNTTSGNVSLINSGDLNITGIDESGGDVNVNNAGTITVTGLVIASGGGTVNLMGTGTTSDILVNANITSGTGAVTLTAGKDVVLNAGNLTTAGSVNLTAGKSISEAGVGLITGGLLTTSSTTGTLLNNTNHVSSFNALNTISGDISLVNSGDLNLTGIDETGGNVSVTDVGTITVSGLVHAAGAGTVTLMANGVASDINVNADLTSGTGALTLLAGENITLNAGNLTTLGPVNLTADKSISESGTGLITASLLTTGSTAGTVLNNANRLSSFHAVNTVSGNVSVVNSGNLNVTGIDETGGNVSVVNAGTLTVTGEIKAAGNGNVNLNATGVTSDVLVNSNVKSVSGVLTLNADQNITLNAGDLTTSGAINLTAGKTISEQGVGSITGALLSTNSTTGTLLTNLNHVTGFHAVNTVSGNINLVNSGSLNVTGINESGGNVSLTNAGSVTVSGVVAAAAGGTVAITANGSVSDILLNADLTSGSGLLRLSADRNVTLQSGNMITTGAVELSAGKTISETGTGLIRGGLLTTTSSTGTVLANTNQVSRFNAVNSTTGNIALVNSGNLNITGIDETGGNVSVTDAGTITVTGLVKAAGSGTVTLTANGSSSNVRLDADVRSGTGVVALVAGQDVMLNAGNVTTGGAVNLTAGKSISEAGVGLITGTLLSTTSTTGTTLSNLNQISGFHAVNSTSGNVTLSNGRALNVTGIDETGGNVSVTNAGTLTISGVVKAALAGTVGLSATGAISDILINADVSSGSGILTITAGQHITLNAGNVTTSGPVNLTAGKSITEAGAGKITGTQLTTSSSTGTVLGNTNAVSRFQAENTLSGNIVLVNSGDLIVTGIDQTGGSVSVSDVGSITVSGAIKAATTGAINLTATGVSSDILVNANVTSGTGPLTLSADRNVNLNTGNLTTGGPVNIAAGKAISESGSGIITGSLLTTTSTTGTTLSNTNFVSGFHAVNTASGNVNLVNSGSLNITGIDETGGNVSVTNAGTTNVSGQIRAAAAGTVTLLTTGTGSDITVNANVVSGSGALFLNAAANITLIGGSLVTAGGIDLTAAKGISEAGSGTITGGLLTTTSSTGTVLNNVNHVARFHALNTTTGNISLTNAGALEVTGIDETGGDVTLLNTGSVLVTGGILNRESTGQITMKALGAVSDLHLVAGINSQGGAISLQAGHDVLIDSTAPVKSLSGDIEIVAVNSAFSAVKLDAGNDLRITAGSNINSSAPLTGGNSVSIQSVGTTTLTSAAVISSGAGGVSIDANQLVTAANITTLSGPVFIKGLVQLTGDILVQTLAGGDITVQGAVNGTASGAQDLTFAAGTGNILVTGDVGSIVRLDSLVITSAHNVRFGGDITSNVFQQQSGTGVTTMVGDVNTFGVISGSSDGFQFQGASLQFAPSTSSLNSHGQNITITADAITLPTTFTNAIGATVTLKTLSSATSIGLNDASQNLNFTGTQLGTIHSTNVIIGSDDQTGGIIIGTTGAIQETKNFILKTAASLVANGQFSLDLGHTLQASIGTDVIVAAGGGLSSSAGQILVSTGRDVINHGRIETAAGPINFTVGRDFFADGTLQSQTGPINLTVARDAELAGQISLGSAPLTWQAGRDSRFDGASQIHSILGDVIITSGTANPQAGEIFMAAGAVITAGLGHVIMTANQDVTIGLIESARLIDPAIKITSILGGIVNGNGLGETNLNAGTVVLRAASGIGSDNSLELNVANLAASNAGSGNIQFDNVTGRTLRIVTADGVTGINNTGTSSGNVNITNGAAIEVASHVVNSTGGDISLDAFGSNADITILAQVMVAGGNGSITFNAGNNVNLVDTGNAVDISSQGAGVITMNAQNLVQFGSNVVVQSGTGSIIDAPPRFVNFQTPQLNAVTGFATISGEFGRTGESHFVITINWGDGTPLEVHDLVVAGPNQFEYTHRYTRNPNPSDPSAPIPVSVTVNQDPLIHVNASNGTVDNNFGGNRNLLFSFAGAVPLGSLDFVTLTSTISIPGEGLTALVFDTTPPVKYLHFPEVQLVEEVFHHAVSPLNQVGVIDHEVTVIEGAGSGQRLIILEILSADGTAQQRIKLPETALDDLLGSLRKNSITGQTLPDGKYRVLLQEPGETRERLVFEFEIVNGTIDDGSEATRDRPPTSKSSGPEMPADAPVPEAGATDVPPDSAGDQTFFDSHEDPAGTSWNIANQYGEAAGELPKPVAAFGDGEGRPFIAGQARRDWVRAGGLQDENVMQAASDEESDRNHSDAAETDIQGGEADAAASVVFVGMAGVGLSAMANNRQVTELKPMGGIRLTRGAALMRKWLSPRGVTR